MGYLTEAFSEQVCPPPFLWVQRVHGMHSLHMWGAPFVCITRVHKHDLLMQKALDSLVNTCDAPTAV